MNNTTEMPMNYHKILYLIEGYFIFKNIMDIVTSFMLPYSLYRTIDQIFYIVCIVFCAFGIWKHNTKKGVIAFFSVSSNRSWFSNPYIYCILNVQQSFT